MFKVAFCLFVLCRIHVHSTFYMVNLATAYLTYNKTEMDRIQIPEIRNKKEKEVGIITINFELGI